MSSVQYQVEHVTRYVYGDRIATSQHLAYLHPRTLDYQRVHWYELTIDPPPSTTSQRVDYFGNVADHFTILTPYLELRATSRSLVEISPRPHGVDPNVSPAWEDVRDALVYRPGAAFDPAVELVCASPYVGLEPELAAFAMAAFTPRRPLLAAAFDLMERINREFRFDTGATSITTPVTRVLTDRRGVCQDFAHLQIACLRSLGLSARYVSGYLLTDPPPGQPRLVGADASHAWLSVYCPVHGWVDLDPTNNLVPGLRHVTLAWGRDYGDVSPLRGVVLGGAEQSLHVGVSVVPVEG
jgi:transglutaminase-like putative cysteine protease